MFNGFHIPKGCGLEYQSGLAVICLYKYGWTSKEVGGGFSG